MMACPHRPLLSPYPCLSTVCLLRTDPSCHPTQASLQSAFSIQTPPVTLPMPLYSLPSPYRPLLSPYPGLSTVCLLHTDPSCHPTQASLQSAFSKQTPPVTYPGLSTVCLLQTDPSCHPTQAPLQSAFSKQTSPVTYPGLSTVCLLQTDPSCHPTQASLQSAFSIQTPPVTLPRPLYSLPSPYGPFLSPYPGLPTVCLPRTDLSCHPTRASLQSAFPVQTPPVILPRPLYSLPSPYRPLLSPYPGLSTVCLLHTDPSCPPTQASLQSAFSTQTPPVPLPSTLYSLPSPYRPLLSPYPGLPTVCLLHTDPPVTLPRSPYSLPSPYRPHLSPYPGLSTVCLLHTDPSCHPTQASLQSALSTQTPSVTLPRPLYSLPSPHRPLLSPYPSLSTVCLLHFLSCLLTYFITL